MKNLIKITGIIILGLFVATCSDYPIDDRNLLITDHEECSMTVFELLGPDNRNTLVGTAVIDNETNTVTAVAKFGTNLKHVKPRCSVEIDCIVTPMMGEWVDFTQSRQYTVISGNRQIKKTYTITVTVQGE
ncbi:MAG: DUF5018 domain-containing protein [Dysgonamonadaceae bacterium]|jgi:hypothetical protein|nr:DUF5018 domain-containing protein [Dysgonamonadaceae bacterium]